MRIELGAHVRTSDGEEAGTIEKLVLDPASGDVKLAVIRKGGFLGADVEVPLEALTIGSGDTVGLSYTKDELDTLPRFYEGNYTSPPTGYATPYGYPYAGMLWPVGGIEAYPAPTLGLYDQPAADPKEAEMLRRQDLKNAVIDEGSDVKSRDGEKVGEVHRVTFDAESGQPVSLVVRKGFLFTEDLELTADLIDSVDDGEVVLNRTKDQIEADFKARAH